VIIKYYLLPTEWDFILAYHTFYRILRLGNDSKEGMNSTLKPLNLIQIEIPVIFNYAISLITISVPVVQTYRNYKMKIYVKSEAMEFYKNTGMLLGSLQRCLSNFNLGNINDAKIDAGHAEGITQALF